jgi:hypothetical protein
MEAREPAPGLRIKTRTYVTCPEFQMMGDIPLGYRAVNSGDDPAVTVLAGAAVLGGKDNLVDLRQRCRGVPRCDAEIEVFGARRCLREGKNGCGEPGSPCI